MTPARTQVVSPQLFLQQLVAMDDALPAFYVRFRWIASPALAHWLERKLLDRLDIAYCTSI